ncbi:D-serine ammonia-lyase [Desulfitobacterium dehalogenans ATCC 51507]|uniref:Probable D-serine dehydratase n=1 Tax=Desulfitobacterium dehalogenans (strain ATCC 51507 / DSM 9161 / JW/IU-DC1) TaxID=756499 RepID=I4A9P6_DESDJ|nr:D-serine ammonia-lyase [Desulfitobacterium dehalogenans ATCC 51507]
MDKRDITVKSPEFISHIPVIQDLIAARETFWINPYYRSVEKLHGPRREIDLSNILDADERLRRFAHYIVKAFPETQPAQGLIESPVIPIESMHRYLESHYGVQIPGEIWLKCDNYLPVSGSIKARGGIYEVLKHAEGIGISQGLLTTEDDYSILINSSFRDIFSHYRIAVGSTGNLGLSIGVMGAQLGFKVTVHMSADAKEWKKALLRSKGVEVIEYTSDYSKAVEEGRRQAEGDPHCHFVDDENSRDLFLGYAVAGLRLKEQLLELNLRVDADHPLFVYLPCGVGGGPGGVAFGLKQVFKDNVHCFFAEPTHSPCMLLGLATGLHDRIAVQDIGLDNKTEADGLAVGRASSFVGKIMEGLLSGAFTIEDEELFRLLQALDRTQGIQCEPSSLAGMAGPARLLRCHEGLQYLRNHQLEDALEKGTHLVWATGGSLVPKEVMKNYLFRKK